MIRTVHVSVAPSADSNNWNAVVERCKSLVLEIHAHLTGASQGHHNLGTTLIAANLHGEQLEMLAEELGKTFKGFSLTNLYNAIKFARKYPNFEDFLAEHGDCPLRQVHKLLVDHPRTKSNALDSQAGSQQPASNNTGLVRKYVKLEPKTLEWYKYELDRGFQGDISTFLNKCVAERYKLSGPLYYMLHDDGKIEFLDSPLLKVIAST